MIVVLLVGLGLIYAQLVALKKSAQSGTDLRHELNEALGPVEQRLKVDLALNRREQAESLKGVGDSMDRRLNALGAIVDNRLQRMQKDNSDKLEVMRATVDEKLHATLEKRLGESFKLVSDRLESVHKGLGEMQTLATGVGDLKKVLTNVKTRGTWGEVQLGSLLEQIMTPAQYEKNVAVKKRSAERVEFAIKLPNGPDEETPLWLPIDAKFPVEDYQRLVAAREAADLPMIESLSRDLVNRIKSEARDIRDKYIAPPETTDFGIMYLPTEGLYAEVTQRPGLQELLQRDYRVMVAGPNTIAALMNSLRMGFKTLAIEKRSSEVWQILGAVKSEFGKFGDLLDKTQKKLQEASSTIESAATKSRTIERKLDRVQDLPAADEAEPVALIGREQL